MGRKEIKEILESFGGKVSDAVSKNTDVVIVGENPGSKYQDAIDLKITIWDEEKFAQAIFLEKFVRSKQFISTNHKIQAWGGNPDWDEDSEAAETYLGRTRPDRRDQTWLRRGEWTGRSPLLCDGNTQDPLDCVQRPLRFLLSTWNEGGTG